MEIDISNKKKFLVCCDYILFLKYWQAQCKVFMVIPPKTTPFAFTKEERMIRERGRL